MKRIQTILKLIPLILLAIILLLVFKLKSTQQKVIDFKAIQETQFQEIERWKDFEGKSRARAEIAEISARNAKLVLNKELKDFLKKEVGSIKKNLISYTSVKSSTTGTIATKSVDTIYLVNEIKSLPAKQFKIHTSDLKFDGLYVPELDTLMANYKINHNFDLLYYYKRPGKFPWNLFKRKRAVAEIKFYNQQSKTDSLFTVILERNRKK